MFVGLVGMMCSMAVLAGCISSGGRDAEGNIVLAEAEGDVATLTLFTFNTFFAIGRSRGPSPRSDFIHSSAYQFDHFPREFTQHA